MQFGAIGLESFQPKTAAKVPHAIGVTPAPNRTKECCRLNLFHESLERVFTTEENSNLPWVADCRELMDQNPKRLMGTQGVYTLYE
jgi:hypothetical protein